MMPEKRYFDCQPKNNIKKTRDIKLVRNKVFSDESDYINNVRFKIAVPYHVLKIPKVVEEKEIIPSWYSEIDPNRLVSQYITLADVIELCYNKVPFKILDSEELVTMIEYLRWYLYKLDPIKDQDTEYSSYYNKCSITLECLIDILQRIMKDDRGLKERIKPSSSIVSILERYKR